MTYFLLGILIGCIIPLIVVFKLKQKLAIAQTQLAEREQVYQGMQDKNDWAEKLKTFTEQLEILKQAQNRSDAQLNTQLAQLNKETQTLSHAFCNPNQRGQWGELQLERLLEYAGLKAGIHYDHQASISGSDKRLRPDIIVHLPNNRSVIIDAKTPQWEDPLTNPEAAWESGNKSICQHIRASIDQLSNKDYPQYVDSAIDSVILFLPGEWILSRALQADPQLLDYSCGKNILLASPTTLIALLKAIHYGWKQNEMLREIQNIAQLGGELYDRLHTWMQHLQKVGDGLSKAVDGYNKAIRSLESRVLPAANKLHICSKKNDPIPSLNPLEAIPQVPHLAQGTSNELPLNPSEPSEPLNPPPIKILKRRDQIPYNEQSLSKLRGL